MPTNFGSQHSVHIKSLEVQSENIRRSVYCKLLLCTNFDLTSKIPKSWMLKLCAFLKFVVMDSTITTPHYHASADSLNALFCMCAVSV